MQTEMFEVVDPDGRVLSLAPRSECHGNPELLHQAVHVLVFTANGELVLQQRHATKDVQPNKWDSSVGGHVQPGEAAEVAAAREMEEELGVDSPLTFCYRYLWRTSFESELITTFRTICDGPFTPQLEEVSAVRPWSKAEISAALSTGVFTPNFEYEWQHYHLDR